MCLVLIWVFLERHLYSLREMWLVSPELSRAKILQAKKKLRHCTMYIREITTNCSQQCLILLFLATVSIL